MKVVYAGAFGSHFLLSPKLVRKGRELSGNPKWGGACLRGDRDERWPPGEFLDEDWPCGYFDDRSDPTLVQLAKEAGLNVIDIPAGKVFRICPSDAPGQEWIEYPEDIEWQVAK